MGSDKWPASKKIIQLQLSMETDDGIFNIHHETFSLIFDIVELHSKTTDAFHLESRCAYEAKTLKIAQLKGKLLIPNSIIFQFCKNN